MTTELTTSLTTQVAGWTTPTVVVKTNNVNNQLLPNKHYKEDNIKLDDSRQPASSPPHIMVDIHDSLLINDLNT